MLGEQIGHEIGQVTGIRVLPDSRIEVSFQSDGTILGIHENNMGTYITETRPDGTLFGEGQGVAMTDEGEAVTWKGQGVGRFTGRGTAVAWRGAVYYQTTSERLARLNGVAGVYEYATDESGKAESNTFEWK